MRSNNSTWSFDVGNGISNIDSLKDTYNVVLSHFHLDHTGNLNSIKINKIYCSKETYKHLTKETIDKCEIVIITEELIINDIRIFLIPSSHAKGSLTVRQF